MLWLAHTTIVANALGGLENVASAFQLLLLYCLLAGAGGQWTHKRSAVIGLLLGWALLTRPDGGLFALVLFVLWLPLLWPAVGRRWPALLTHLFLIGIAAAVVLILAAFASLAAVRGLSWGRALDPSVATGP